MITAVTGATGHIGANLVRALIASGRRVRCLTRQDRAALAGLDVECVPGDVLDPATLRDTYAWFAETGRLRLEHPLEAGAAAGNAREDA